MFAPHLNILSAAACVCSILFALSLAFARSGQLRLNFFFLQTEARQTPEQFDLNCFYQGDCNELRSTPIWASIQKTFARRFQAVPPNPFQGRAGFAIISITGVSRSHRVHTARHSCVMMGLALQGCHPSHLFTKHHYDN